MNARTIGHSELRPADILVTTGRAFISGAIRMATGTDYSHTVLYIGANKVIEAIDKGVVERSLDLALDEATLAVALRRRNMSSWRRNLVIGNAHAFRTKPYDYVGAAGAGLSHNRGKLACGLSPVTCGSVYISAKINASDKNKDKRFFCSELVARCYELAGAPITDDDPSFTTPRAVRVAKTLLYVGHLIGGP